MLEEKARLSKRLADNESMRGQAWLEQRFRDRAGGAEPDALNQEAQ